MFASRIGLLQHDRLDLHYHCGDPESCSSPHLFTASVWYLSRNTTFYEKCLSLHEIYCAVHLEENCNKNQNCSHRWRQNEEIDTIEQRDTAVGEIHKESAQARRKELKFLDPCPSKFDAATTDALWLGK